MTTPKTTNELREEFEKFGEVKHHIPWSNIADWWLSHRTSDTRALLEQLLVEIDNPDFSAVVDEIFQKYGKDVDVNIIGKSAHLMWRQMQSIITSHLAQVE